MAYVRDKWVGENLAFGTVCRVGRRFPSMAPKVAKLVASTATEREFVDRSDRVFCSPRRVRFVEMEYGIPVERLPEAAESARPDSSPADPRAVPDRGACRRPTTSRSPPGLTDVGVIAVHQYRGMPYEEYFAGVERIMDDYDGRPHWGKLHGQRSNAEGRYPQWDVFADTRERLDPDRTFANPYLDRALG